MYSRIPAWLLARAALAFTITLCAVLFLLILTAHP